MRKIACLVMGLGIVIGAQAEPRAGEAACVAAVKASLRDPESIRLVRVTRDDTPFQLELDGKPQPARGYEVVVNARNGFGGYTGNKGWACVVDDVTERKVLRLVAPS